MAYKHGQSGTILHGRWIQMRDRCNNPNNTHYAWYGGRGIGVCERWNDFTKFAKDMGQPPKGKTLDRIDSSGPYSPENCRWATRKEQQNNRRCNINITYKGVTRTVVQWSEETGLHRNTIDGRLKLGWPARKIFSEYKHINFDGLRLGGDANAKRQQAKTHCKRGHKYTAGNTGSQISKKGTPSRFCKTCKAQGYRDLPILPP